MPKYQIKLTQTGIAPSGIKSRDVTDYIGGWEGDDWDEFLRIHDALMDGLKGLARRVGESIGAARRVTYTHKINFLAVGPQDPDLPDETFALADHDFRFYQPYDLWDVQKMVFNAIGKDAGLVERLPEDDID